MSKIIAIVAVSPEGIIAINGSMPWDVPEDLSRFKNLTEDNVVIMGRKTWESLGKTTLPNRINYVVSRNGGLDLVNKTSAICYRSLDYAVNEAELKYPEKDIYIMGGANVYSQALPICDEVELTIIEEDQVKITEGTKLYLKEFPKVIDSLFELDSKFKTQYATYKTYKRRAVSIRNKDRTVYPQT